MELRLNALFRSNEQFHVRFVNGERKEEGYYLYYMFHPKGIWISRTVDYPALDMEGFLADVDMVAIHADPDHDEPLLPNRELRYQSGTFKVDQGTVWLKWKHSQLEGEERQWYFRIREEDDLHTDFEEVTLRVVE